MSSKSVDVNSSSSSTSVPAEAEKLCYIPCSFCNIILAVSVPSSSLFDIVTVRCGHCTNLWSVNMAAALHSLSASWQQQQQQLHLQHQLRSLHHQQPQTQQQLKQPQPQPLQQHHHHHQDLRLQAPSAMATNYRLDLAATAPAAAARCNKQLGTCTAAMTRGTPICNEKRAALQLSRPPEKKQRVPSAYNQFIKEEIQRIKANNPDISHKEAFSTAAKNWAHFPHIQFGLMLENNNQARLREGSDRTVMTKTAIFNK